MNASGRHTRWAKTSRNALRLAAVAVTLLCVSGSARPNTYSLAVRPAAGIPFAAAVRPVGVVELTRRARALRFDMKEVEKSYATEVAPLIRELSNQSRDSALVRRIAFALVREGHASGLDPRLLLSVLLVENARLRVSAVSHQGAVGLMQVMPSHAGGWGCGSEDLTDPDANICHGARILAHDLAAVGGDLDRALLRYNGCVRGVNTPDCRLYPVKVYRRASLALFRAAPD